MSAGPADSVKAPVKRFSAEYFRPLLVPLGIGGYINALIWWTWGFGAGGWENSKLEKILPVDMAIPAQRQVGKGALVLIMHSCEMPNGNYYGEMCAQKAVDTLSSRDEIGVISYDWQGGGSNWDFPLAKKGDGTKVKAAVKNMKLGDMPSFDDTLTVTLNGKKVHDHIRIDGITGGALDSNEGTPGPIMLQGDHGKVWYRKVTVTPIMK